MTTLLFAASVIVICVIGFAGYYLWRKIKEEKMFGK